MKKKTWILRIFCSLLLLLLPLTANAQALYGLTVHCSYQKSPAAGLELKLYRAGSLDGQGRFIPAGEFGSGRSTCPTEWDTLADSLAVLAKDLPPLDTKKTGPQGTAAFSGLEEGLYLVVAEDGKTDYEVQSFLAALPGRDPGTGAELENVDVYPKIRQRQAPDPTSPTATTAPGTNPGKPSRLPQTGQDWQSPCILALIGLGACCAAVMTRQRTRRFAAIAAALCLLGALGAVRSNLHRSAESGRQAGETLDRLLPVVYANAQEAPTTETTLPETEPAASVPEMPAQTVNGWDYIGYLSIPSLDLTLPIQSQWSYEGLRVAPGRFYGSTYTGDLVLAAHNYSQHFGRIGDLQPGDTVCFTDMDGHVTHYRVTALETLAPEDVEGMLSGEYDLTLFTCTLGGKSRVTVRCTEK